MVKDCLHNFSVESLLVELSVRMLIIFVIDLKSVLLLFSLTYLRNMKFPGFGNCD